MNPIISSLLYPLGLTYAGLVNLRNKFYSRQKVSLGLPTISIGNISVGGTGKTPFTLYLAQKIHCWGQIPFVLTRGYKANPPTYPFAVSPTDSPNTAGDEPLLLAKQGLQVIIDPNRVRAAQFALQNYTPTSFLLDDGFQQTKIFKDLDLVLLAPRDFYNWNRPLPSGYWREGEKGLTRADIFLVNLQGNNLSLLQKLATKKLKKFSKPLLFFDYKITYLEHVQNKEQTKKLKNYLLITTLANPQKIVKSLLNFGLNPPDLHLSYPDHYFFKPHDRKKILRIIREKKLNLVCTEKEKDKLVGILNTQDIWVIKSHIVFSSKEEEDLLLQKVKNILQIK
jgi:tetraacyldisaccharide 4'-kinase